jgi:DNA-binding IscR family transcriptional regulator
VLVSVKGPAAGFALNQHTLLLPLIRLIEVTDGLGLFSTCVLRLKECNASNACAMHHKMEVVNRELKAILGNTTIGELIDGNKFNFIKSLSSAVAVESLTKMDFKEKNN